MDEKHKPIENEVPKHKKKSKKKGRPRADHKHEYKEVVLHSWWVNPYKHSERNEHINICKVCTICGRIDTYITCVVFQTEEEMKKYDIQNMDHWYVDDCFDKFAKKMEELK